MPSRIQVTNEGVVKIADQNNRLLTYLSEHPQFNKQNPAASPKPLWFTADFVRRTYLEYIMPLLPEDAQNKSSKIANKAIFPYSPPVPGDNPPFPESANEEWLMDNKNWPKNNNARARELYSDAIQRTMMLHMMMTDRQMGPMMMGGAFDWDRDPRIKAVLEEVANSD